MTNLFRLEVDTGGGGYGYDDNFEELLEDVSREFGIDVMKEVLKWALTAESGDEFNKYNMLITCM